MAIVTVRKCSGCARSLAGRYFEFRAVLALHGDALTQAEAVRECCSVVCVETVLAEMVRKVRRKP